jgi:hypothetical protein
MKWLIAALCLAFAASGAWAQGKKDAKKEPTAAAPSAAQKAQKSRMSACNKQATEKKLKGDERKKFMSSCLKN